MKSAHIILKPKEKQSAVRQVMCARNAHDGGRVHCAAVGADGHLFTGGDDKVLAESIQTDIRR